MISKVLVFKCFVIAFFAYICYFLICFNIYFSKLNFNNFNLLKNFDKYLLNKQVQKEDCDYTCSYKCTIQKFNSKELFERCNSNCNCILIDESYNDTTVVSSKFTIIFILLLITFFLSYQSKSITNKPKSKAKISDDDLANEFNEYKEALI